MSLAHLMALVSLEPLLMAVPELTALVSLEPLVMAEPEVTDLVALDGPVFRASLGSLIYIFFC